MFTFLHNNITICFFDLDKLKYSCKYYFNKIEIIASILVFKTDFITKSSIFYFISPQALDISEIFCYQFFISVLYS